MADIRRTITAVRNFLPEYLIFSQNIPSFTHFGHDKA